jgi:hypothetical protein
MGLMSNDTDSNSAGGTVSNAGQVKGDDTAKKGLTWSTMFGVGA